MEKEARDCGTVDGRCFSRNYRQRKRKRRKNVTFINKQRWLPDISSGVAPNVSCHSSLVRTLRRHGAVSDAALPAPSVALQVPSLIGLTVIATNRRLGGVLLDPRRAAGHRVGQSKRRTADRCNTDAAPL